MNNWKKILLIGCVVLLAACTKSVLITGDYLMIPAQDGGKMSKLEILSGGKNILGEPQYVEIAQDRVDYYIPIDVTEYKGQSLDICLTGVDKNNKFYKRFAQSDVRVTERDERYRPRYHFAPDFGWTNDPNGMVYYDGEYHLAYQANPYGIGHYNMHWGNAVSTDLMHWEDLPPIIAPDSLGAIFSGSAIVDDENTAGFGKDAIVAMYTSAGRLQRQSIAYSLDRGRTYTKYEGNPVITDLSRRDFRDPKLSRFGDKWIVAIAAGDVIAFYASKDLKNWEKLSEFGKGIGSHAAVWECPDLLKFEYEGKEKWVLLVSINPGNPNGGSITQYFIGSFDGKEFKADPLPYPLWVDLGADNYAGVTFAGKEDRHIFMGWMSNWYYSGATPTKRFRNCMTLPRDLSLKSNGRHLILASNPSPEVYASMKQVRSFDDTKVGLGFSIPQILEENHGAYSIAFTIQPDTKGKLAVVLSNTLGEKMVYHFDFSKNELSLDRSESGLVDFEPRFASKPIVTHIVERAEYKVEMFVDRQSIEMFVGEGDVSFTNSMFPSEYYDKFEITADGCNPILSEITINEIN
jgi:fructan beta-fructosidase